LWRSVGKFLQQLRHPVRTFCFGVILAIARFDTDNPWSDIDSEQPFASQTSSRGHQRALKPKRSRVIPYFGSFCRRRIILAVIHLKKLPLIRVAALKRG